MIEMERSSRREFLRLSPRFNVFERFGQVNAPVFAKPPEKDLRLHCPRTFECSLIAALLIVIFGFSFWPTYGEPTSYRPPVQEIVKVEDIEQTRQQNRPPPPPRPMIPIEMPADEMLEDVTIASTEIDLTQDMAPPPPREGFGDEEKFFVAVEEMPQIIGGMEDLLKHLAYPDLALRAGVQGRVFVTAYVDREGNVVKTEVLQGVGVGLDEEAQRAVEKLKFIPGKQRGKPVRVRVVIPVTFAINKAHE